MCPECQNLKSDPPTRLGKEPFKNGKLKFDRAKSAISLSLFPRDGDAELLKKEDERAAAQRADLAASRPKGKRPGSSGTEDAMRRPRPRLANSESEEEEEMLADAVTVPHFQSSGRSAPASEATATFELTAAPPATSPSLWTTPFLRVSPALPVPKLAEYVAGRLDIDPKQSRVQIMLTPTAPAPMTQTVGEALALAAAGQQQRIREGSLPLLTYRIVPSRAPPAPGQRHPMPPPPPKTHFPHPRQQQGGPMGAGGRAAGASMGAAAGAPAAAPGARGGGASGGLAAAGSASAANGGNPPGEKAPRSSTAALAALRSQPAVMAVVDGIRANPATLNEALRKLASDDRKTFDMIQDNQMEFRDLLKFGAADPAERA